MREITQLTTDWLIDQINKPSTSTKVSGSLSASRDAYQAARSVIAEHAMRHGVDVERYAQNGFLGGFGKTLLRMLLSGAALSAVGNMTPAGDSTPGTHTLSENPQNPHWEGDKHPRYTSGQAQGKGGQFSPKPIHEDQKRPQQPTPAEDSDTKQREREALAKLQAWKDSRKQAETSSSEQQPGQTTTQKMFARHSAGETTDESGERSLLLHWANQARDHIKSEQDFQNFVGRFQVAREEGVRLGHNPEPIWKMMEEFKRDSQANTGGEGSSGVSQRLPAPPAPSGSAGGAMVRRAVPGASVPHTGAPSAAQPGTTSAAVRPSPPLSQLMANPAAAARRAAAPPRMTQKPLIGPDAGTHVPDRPKLPPPVVKPQATLPAPPEAGNRHELQTTTDAFGDPVVMQDADRAIHDSSGVKKRLDEYRQRQAAKRKTESELSFDTAELSKQDADSGEVEYPGPAISKEPFSEYRWDEKKNKKVVTSFDEPAWKEAVKKRSNAMKKWRRWTASRPDPAIEAVRSIAEEHELVPEELHAAVKERAMMDSGHQFDQEREDAKSYLRGIFGGSTKARQMRDKGGDHLGYDFDNYASEFASMYPGVAGLADSGSSLGTEQLMFELLQEGVTQNPLNDREYVSRVASELAEQWRDQPTHSLPAPPPPLPVDGEDVVPFSRDTLIADVKRILALHRSPSSRTLLDKTVGPVVNFTMESME